MSLAKREVLQNNHIDQWMRAEEARFYRDELVSHMLIAEPTASKNPIQLIRRLAYMLKRLYDPYDEVVRSDNKADWLKLRSGIVMRNYGRHHVRDLIDVADSLEGLNYIMSVVAKVATEGSELRFVVDSTFRPLQEGPIQFEQVVLENLRTGNPLWEAKPPNLIRRVSLVRKDYENRKDKLNISINTDSFETRQLTKADAEETELLFNSHYPGNSFRKDHIEQYNFHYGSFPKYGEEKGKPVAVQGGLGEFRVELFGNKYHIYLVGNGVTHTQYRGESLAKYNFQLVIEDIFRRDPNALLIGDAYPTMYEVCRQFGFKGGADNNAKDHFWWYAFEVPGIVRQGED